MTDRSETIRQLLRQGPTSARQLTDIMGISQPTISRAMKALGDEVVRIGTGLSIHYVLRDAFRGFSSAPIYRINLAPAYDILPMGFAPKSGGEIVNTLRPATLLDAIGGETWREALELAERFYALARDCDRFSASFAPCLRALRAHLDEARSRISRLG
ncbi:TPA: ArsR family transcriptional regulator [Enterobacter mori]|nr:ArsR family transcriptional regulator [Enterobacter mori]HDR2778077.1 ArsR family transcriptional regulator [Enterobacter mori]